MNLEEIVAKAKEDDNLRKQLVAWLPKTTEGKELLDNYFNSEFEKKIGDKVSEIHTSYDNDIFEILGERKKADQKTYDYVKNLVTELKELRTAKGEGNENKVKELQAKIKELQDSGSVNEHWKKIYNEAVSKWEAKEKEYKTQIEEQETKYRTTQVEGALKSALGSLKFKQGIPQEAIDALIKVNEESILKHAKVIDGKVVFHKDDGTPWLNEEYKPISAQEIVKGFLKTMIDDGSSEGNAGGGASPKINQGKIVTTGEGDNAKKKLILDTNSFSTKLEFNKVAEKALRSQGITASDKEYNELLDQAYEEYKVSDLEFQ